MPEMHYRTIMGWCSPLMTETTTWAPVTVQCVMAVVSGTGTVSGTRAVSTAVSTPFAEYAMSSDGSGRHYRTVLEWCSTTWTAATVQLYMTVDSVTTAVHAVWTPTAEIPMSSDGTGLCIKVNSVRLLMWSPCDQPVCGWLARSLPCSAWNSISQSVNQLTWMLLKSENISVSCLTTNSVSSLY